MLWGAQQRKGWPGKHSQLLTTEWSHPHITAFWGQHWARQTARDIKTRFYTLLWAPELPHTACVKAASMQVIIYPSNLHTTSFLLSQLQSKPATVLPSLFQASFILMRSEVFPVLAIYSHQATVMETQWKVKYEEKQIHKVNCHDRDTTAPHAERERQNHFKISLYKYKKCTGHFWD